MKEKFLEKLKEALITYSFSTKIPLVLLDENGEGLPTTQLFYVSNSNRKAIIEKTKFGVYKFKVVR